jgi:alkanesulfonate monooxygenase SsuD/methylene tetrahydromethanopterin reductase-like flavin-dependent oxidoreductase (luciferase family)
VKPAFGISVTPYAEAYPEIVAQVLDTFALIGDLLARTTRLRFFPDVASLPMRPPRMLAKPAASLGAMSGGRFELGIGAGAFWDAIAGIAG